MTDYLLLRLYGAQASWGEIAVGETRHTAAHPSRSALLGLLAAALGIDRNHEAQQMALAGGYRFAICLDGVGTLLRDFHTVQQGVPGRRQRFRSRRQELSTDKVDTMLSAREYRCDAHAIIAVEALETAPYSLAKLAEALTRPVYTLYLGRKSCPLAAPVSPQLVVAMSVSDALAKARWPSLMRMAGYGRDEDWPGAMDRWVFGLRGARLYWDNGMEVGVAPSFEHTRHDDVLSRQRWQFGPRREWVALRERGQS
ncbi:type I-E CRISPR-associated protein Cas5/CasD [Pusillimonas sp. TS35]|nr:type I-E CRISPR-associated protein Cas5/CasD [Pusillimonas sp. TS35]